MALAETTIPLDDCTPLVIAAPVVGAPLTVPPAPTPMAVLVVVLFIEQAATANAESEVNAKREMTERATERSVVSMIGTKKRTTNEDIDDEMDHENHATKEPVADARSG